MTAEEIDFVSATSGDTALGVKAGAGAIIGSLVSNQAWNEVLSMTCTAVETTTWRHAFGAIEDLYYQLP